MSPYKEQLDSLISESNEDTQESITDVKELENSPESTISKYTMSIFEEDLVQFGVIWLII